VTFDCNICGARTSADSNDVLAREKPTCSNCKSSLRFRGVIAALQARLFGEITPLIQLPGKKEIRGLGMSDARSYSMLLEEKFSYINTFYHQEPYLDITNPGSHFKNRFDFVISSDVMEHVHPPVELAFRNLHTLLRPGGVLVLSTPFVLKGRTIEHYPDLYQFEILGSGAERRLINTTRDGRQQVFRDLVFHGGKGATLEMRLFSQPELLKLLQDSAFSDVRIHAKSFPEWGIVYSNPCSLPISAIAA
jgi:SAM-dependent methyltransferase